MTKIRATILALALGLDDPVTKWLPSFRPKFSDADAPDVRDAAYSSSVENAAQH
jgi:hypothetical protein